jgi:hypothetical protein
MWDITIEFPTTQRSYFVADKPFELAAMVSKCNPGLVVSVGAMARIRQTYKDGLLVCDRPDLRQFYSDITDMEQHRWQGGHEWPRE